MKKNFRFLGSALMMALVATSCVGDGFGRDKWDTPSLECYNKYNKANISLADFVALAPTTGTYTITEDYIIEGYVISSDEHGGFYKSIVFQDSPENPTIGLQLEVDRGQNYAKFPVGTQIRINAKGLVLGSDRGIVKLGYTDPNYAIGRIPEAQLEKHISRVCVNGQPHIATIKPIELSSFEEAQADKYINQLVSVSGVQFSDKEFGKTYVNQNPKSDTYRELIDAKGIKAVLKTSEFASYGAELLPLGNGKIAFVVGKNNKNYQIQIRNLGDVELRGARQRTSKVKGGSNIKYLTSGAFIDFENYPTKDFDTVPEFYNDAVLNNLYWQVRQSQNNKYLHLSAFASNAMKPESKTYFAIPIDFSNANGISFKTRDIFYKGEVLKVYYSTDYTPTNANTTLTEITKYFTISNGNIATNTKSFVDSGVWYKPNTLIGKGFIIFEYYGGEGAGLPTTTMQIDNIRIH